MATPEPLVLVHLLLSLPPKVRDRKT